jgi:hypothetical protein
VRAAGNTILTENNRLREPTAVSHTFPDIKKVMECELLKKFIVGLRQDTSGFKSHDFYGILLSKVRGQMW